MHICKKSREIVALFMKIAYVEWIIVRFLPTVVRIDHSLISSINCVLVPALQHLVISFCF